MERKREPQQPTYIPLQPPAHPVCCDSPSEGGEGKALRFSSPQTTARLFGQDSQAVLEAARAHTPQTRQPGPRRCWRDCSCPHQPVPALPCGNENALTQHLPDPWQGTNGMLLEGKPGGVPSFLPHLTVLSRDPNSHSASVAWGLPSGVLSSLCLLLRPLAPHPALPCQLCSRPFPLVRALGAFPTSIFI